MATNNVAGKLIAGFVMAIIGIVLLGTVATSSNAVTNRQTLTETVNIAGAKLAGGAINTTFPLYVQYATDGAATNSLAPVWQKDTNEACSTLNLGFYNNQSGNALTPTTDFTFSTRGKLLLVNTAAINGTGNTTSINYDRCPTDYVNVSWGRSAINVSLGLFAIALLLLSIGIFYSIARDTGMLTQ